MLCPQGDPALGVVLPALYQDKFGAPSQSPHEQRTHYRNGAQLSCNLETNQWQPQLPDQGQVSLIAPGGLTVEGPVAIKGTVDIQGATQIEGSLDVTQDIRSGQDIHDAKRSMADDRATNRHTHKGVSSGISSTSPTGDRQ